MTAEVEALQRMNAVDREEAYDPWNPGGALDRRKSRMVEAFCRAIEEIWALRQAAAFGAPSTDARNASTQYYTSTKDYTFPRWVHERALQLADIAEPSLRVGDNRNWHTVLCHYILATEKEPADPVLLKARALAAELSEHVGLRMEILAGERDDGGLVQDTLKAIRAGMDLAKELGQ